MWLGACAPLLWEAVFALSCDSTPFLWCLPKETVSSRQRKALFLPRRLHHSRERYCLGCRYSSSPDLGRGLVGVGGFVRVRRFLGRCVVAPTACSTPFLCSCAKKRGGAPKKRAFGCRHGSCSVPPASPTDSKPQHHSRLRQADLSARSTTKPLPKSGEDDPRPPRQKRSREWWSRQGKKALFFGGSTPFLWASTKEMGSNGRTGQRPPPNASAHPHNPPTSTSPTPSRARNVPTTDR